MTLPTIDLNMASDQDKVPPGRWINAAVINIRSAEKVLRGEAQTWADGWAIVQPDGSLAWPCREDEFAHIHWIKCTNAASQMHTLAARLSKASGKCQAKE